MSVESPKYILTLMSTVYKRQKTSSTPPPPPCALPENCPLPPPAAPLHCPMHRRRMPNPSAPSVAPPLGFACVPPCRRLETTLPTPADPLHCITPLLPSTCCITHLPPLPLPPFARHVSTTLYALRNPSTAACLCLHLPRNPFAALCSPCNPFATLCVRRNSSVVTCLHRVAPSPPFAHRVTHTQPCLRHPLSTTPIHHRLPPTALRVAYPPPLLALRAKYPSVAACLHLPCAPRTLPTPLLSPALCVT